MAISTSACLPAAARRTGAFDWKEFCELYPGLIGWAIMNLGMAHKQYVTLGRVTNSMVLVNVFQVRAGGM